jgi:SNF2 family DNA or RNA helicase
VSASAPTEGDEARISLPAPLRQYQWDDVNFLLSAESALLADEMGLGKTVQTSVALRLAMRKPDCNRALIVAPVSLTINWEREIQHCSAIAAPQMIERQRSAL